MRERLRKKKVASERGDIEAADAIGNVGRCVTGGALVGTSGVNFRTEKANLRGEQISF